MRVLLVMGLAVMGLSTWAALGRADDDDAKAKPADAQPGFLGVTLDDGVDAPTITGFAEHSPAEKAGLKSGDVIVKVQDKAVKSRDELLEFMQKTKPGEKVTVTVKRDGKEQTIDVTLGTRPKDND